MLDGYHWRLRHYVCPLAVQTFFNQAMFSKDAVYDQILEAFERAVGLPKRTG